MPCSALAVQCGESPLTNLASVLYRAFQKHSNKATPGQQYSSRGHSGGSQSWNWVHSVLTFLTYSVVMGLLLRSIAPSATIMIFSLFIPARFYKEGVVEKQHDRKTETVAVTWAFRSTGREPDDGGSLGAENRFVHNKSLVSPRLVFTLSYQVYPVFTAACPHFVITGLNVDTVRKL